MVYIWKRISATDKTLTNLSQNPVNFLIKISILPLFCTGAEKNPHERQRGILTVLASGALKRLGSGPSQGVPAAI